MSLLQKIEEARHTSQGGGVFNTRLRITPEMLRQARGNKMSMIAIIRPEDFIKVTTRAEYTKEDLTKQCRNVDDYNKWAEEGETIIMPALWIRGESVVSHEGRHRAAALICDGQSEMPISIRIHPEEEHEEKYGYWKAPYKVTSEDLPRAIHGQFGKGIIMKSDIKVIVDGWDNLQQNVTEARTSIDAAQVADMYEQWRDEFNRSDHHDDEVFVMDAGYNGKHNPPVAYTNMKLTAGSKSEAISLAEKYLRISKISLPYTKIDAIGELASIFEDDSPIWFVSVSYNQ